MSESTTTSASIERPSDEAPWPKSEEELVAYIREMRAWPGKSTDMGEAYGRCVYAMSYAAMATFRFLAHELGVTGFQASCADLDILRQSRGYKHGFMVLDANNLLYPQYDTRTRVAEWIDEKLPQLAGEARTLLASSPHAHPDVRAHWERLAALEPASEEAAS